MTAAEYRRLASQASRSADEVRKSFPDNEINRRVARFHVYTCLYFRQLARQARKSK